MSHTCHWLNCSVEVPPNMFCCKKHWFMLPRHIRNKIWVTYRQGQENDKNPSREYIEAAQEARNWILNESHKATS